MWVDAVGKVVGPLLVHVDASGASWMVDLESGELKPVVAFSFFDATSCNGTQYVGTSAVMPGAAFDVEGVLRARDRTTSAIERQMVSQRFNGNCGNASSPYNRVPAVPMNSTRAITRPAAPFVGPIHLEVR